MTDPVEHAPASSLRTGWTIFATRPISMVATVILAVCLFVVSLGILAFPLIPAFYFAVRESRGERFFIDLERVLETMGNLFRGIRRHFFASFVVGILGLLMATGLLVTPTLVMREGAPAYLLGLQILLLPAFFWGGAVLLHAYPRLTEGNGGFAALRYALSEGRRKPLSAFLVGFLVLFPVTGALFHLLMVFSYPILVGAALGRMPDSDELAIPGPDLSGKRPKLFAPTMALALVAGCIGGYQIFGGVGIITWLGLWLSFLIAAAMSTVGVAVGLFGIALGTTTAILGGGTIIARQWGETYVVPWVALCIVVLIVFLRRVFSEGDLRGRD